MFVSIIRSSKSQCTLTPPHPTPLPPAFNTINKWVTERQTFGICILHLTVTNKCTTPSGKLFLCVCVEGTVNVGVFPFLRGVLVLLRAAPSKVHPAHVVPVRYPVVGATRAAASAVGWQVPTHWTCGMARMHVLINIWWDLRRKNAISTNAIVSLALEFTTER